MKVLREFGEWLMYRTATCRLSIAQVAMLSLIVLALVVGAIALFAALWANGG